MTTTATTAATVRSNAYPLDHFPLAKQEEIARAVAEDRPPAKWVRVGPAEIPARAWYEWHWQRGIYPGERQGRPSIPARIRRAVLERDGLTCQLCGGSVERGDVHLDHIFPYSRGGADTVSNLQVAHSACNIRKGARV